MKKRPAQDNAPPKGKRFRLPHSPRAIVQIVAVVVLVIVLDQLVVKPNYRADAVTQEHQAVTSEPPRAALESSDALDSAPPQGPEFAPPMELSLIEPILPYADMEAVEKSVEPAWERNAVPAHPPGQAAKIVVIIDDMGVDSRRSAQIMTLPGPLTLAFLPYASNVRKQADEARAKGYELMVHVPMEPMNGDEDPGPAVLRTGQDAAAFDKVLMDDLSAFDGYVGINNHMGSRLTQDRPAMQKIMAELKKRGLLFVDSRTAGGSVAGDVAAEMDIPHVSRDVFLDHENTLEFVRGALAELEKKAHKNGVAIAIGHPRDATIQALREWLPTLADKGLVLVPVSAAVTRPSVIDVAEPLPVSAP